jgi:CheY-like chemotaxis protein
MPERYQARHTQQRARFAASGRERPMGSGPSFAARRKDGSEFPVAISLEHVQEGDSTFLVAAIRDLTPSLRVLEELALAHTAAERAERTAGEAQQALASRDACLTSLSYSIRQPLQALAVLNGVLARHAQLDDSTLSDAISRQAHAVIQMARLLEAMDDVRQSAPGAIAANLPSSSAATSFDDIAGPTSDSAPHNPVLVVISDATHRGSARLLLKISGYDVLTASSLAEAQAVARRHPDIGLVLTEQQLDDRDSGSQVIACLRDTRGPNTRAVLISNDGISPEINRLKSDPRVRVARIPVQADELLRMLEQLRDDPVVWIK